LVGVKVDPVEAEGIQYTRKDSVVEDLVVAVVGKKTF
jgi:hypothetical protein